MLENLTPKAKRAISFAKEEAFREQKELVDVQCLLVGLMQIDGLASTALTAFDININKIQRYKVGFTSGLLTEPRKRSSDKIDLQDELEKILSKSRYVCDKLSQKYIGPEHLLLAILLDDVGSDLITDLGVNVDSLSALVLRLGGKSHFCLAHLK